MKKHELVVTLHVLTSLVLAFGMVVVGADAAEKYRWLFFLNGTGLIHGTFLVIYPVYCFFFFFLLRPLVHRFLPRPQTTAESSKRLCRTAVWSLIFSAVGWLIPFFVCITGVVLGHVARSRCKADTALYGAGIALTGMVIGYAGLVYQVCVIAREAWKAGAHY